MHEQSLVEALVRQIEGVAHDECAARVVAAHVWVGALSHVQTRDHFQEHFDRAAKGTVAEGAEVRLTMSDDPTHEDANGLRLERIEIEE
ncbi:MAG TPA: hydrogenase/urease maturation nickel metallochaperone HypA [Gaiellaceae bacterium]|nr:hydrogenase/urease maturation nickel metallochaperone HypA [Gaiellaceae bacterium]